MPVHMCMCMSIHMPVYMCMCMSVHMPTHIVNTHVYTHAYSHMNTHVCAQAPPRCIASVLISSHCSGLATNYIAAGGPIKCRTKKKTKKKGVEQREQGRQHHRRRGVVPLQAPTRRRHERQRLVRRNIVLALSPSWEGTRGLLLLLYLRPL